jgi:histidine triad (HIT) family protein
MAADTLFAKIARGEIPSHKVWEDAEHLAFLDIRPLQPGHTLVIPKAVHADAWDMPEEAYGRLMQATRTVAQLLKARTGCARVVSLVIGYEVPHVHVHLVPTHSMADLPPVAGGRQAPQEELAAVAAKLRGGG